jgi:hypothetical protein
MALFPSINQYRFLMGGKPGTAWAGEEYIGAEFGQQAAC